MIFWYYDDKIVMILWYLDIVLPGFAKSWYFKHNPGYYSLQNTHLYTGKIELYKIIQRNVIWSSEFQQEDQKQEQAGAELCQAQGKLRLVYFDRQTWFSFANSVSLNFGALIFVLWKVCFSMLGSVW